MMMKTDMMITFSWCTVIDDDGGDEHTDDHNHDEDDLLLVHCARVAAP